MIIQLESATAENVEVASRNLEALAHSWGHEMIETPANTPEAGLLAVSSGFGPAWRVDGGKIVSLTA